jgi:hypothetical protein
VVKDASSGLVTNHEIVMQMSILQGAKGTAVYVETHQPTNNSNSVSLQREGFTNLSFYKKKKAINQKI